MLSLDDANLNMCKVCADGGYSLTGQIEYCCRGEV